MAYKLSDVAEQQLAEILYSLNCTKSQAISYALESLAAFEKITDDQVLNWLDTEHNEAYKEWVHDHEGQLAPIEPN